MSMIFRMICNRLSVFIALVLTVVPTVAAPIVFAVIGDYGNASDSEREVATRVAGWQPDFVITVGDNNYLYGAADTIDTNVGQFYHAFIYPYKGAYGAGAASNRFFPVLGNHDWGAAYPNPTGAQPYLDYFTLPGNGRYYDFVRGPVHFFALDSDENEPDGCTYPSVQSAWLQAGLAAATEPWKIVYLHHPPFLSGADHTPTESMRWPFAAWGASAVLAGHSHTYERLVEDGIPYFVNGVGGAGLSTFNPVPASGSVYQYNLNFGAMRVEATSTEITFQFITKAGTLKDTLVVTLPYTLKEAALALRAAGGLAAPTSAEATRIKAAAGLDGGAIQVADAVVIARKATGMEANP